MAIKSEKFESIFKFLPNAPKPLTEDSALVKVNIKNFEFDSFLPHFPLTRPAEMRDNANHARNDPASLVVPLLDRRPSQPPMPAYHPKLEKEIRLERRRKDLSLLLHTDKLFHLLSREQAVANDVKDRIGDRKVEEKTQFDLFGRRWVDAEFLRRAVFYRKVADLIVARKTKHEKVRAFQVAAYEFLRENSRMRAVKTHDRILFLVDRAVQNAKAWLEFRTDELYVKTGDHTYRRLKGHGQPREAVVNDLHWEWANLATEIANEWRHDDLRVTTANGSIQHTTNGGGKLIEEVTAKLHQPVILERSERHEYWHDTNFLIETPNHSLMRAHRQGSKPEAAAAALSQPAKDLKTKSFRHWHDRNYLVETANHSLQPATRQGSKPEAATANLAQPRIDERTDKFTRWRDRHFYIETANHSLQPATRQGHKVEAATANLAQPARAEKTAAFQLWHENHRYAETSNGGYAPLLHSPKTLEFVTGEFTAERRSDVTQQHMERRLANLFAPTSNGNWRRLARVGDSVEHVSADVKEQHDQAVLEADDHSNHNRVLAARRSLREIHKNLAAHETQKSLLQEHTVKTPEALEDKTPASNVPDPVPDLPKTKKAS